MKSQTVAERRADFLFLLRGVKVWPGRGKPLEHGLSRKSAAFTLTRQQGKWAVWFAQWISLFRRRYYMELRKAQLANPGGEKTAGRSNYLCPPNNQ